MTRQHKVLAALSRVKEPLSVYDIVEYNGGQELKPFKSCISHCAAKKWIRQTGLKLAYGKVLYEITYFGRQRLKELQND